MAKSNMKKYERTCQLCGTKYHYCNHGCSEYVHMEPWHSAFCSKNCLDLYNITAGYVNGWLPKEVEAERLKAIDLSNFDNFVDWAKEPILEMKKMWEDSSNDKKEDTKTEETKKEEVKETVDEEIKDEKSDKPSYTKDYNKNRYRAKK